MSITKFNVATTPAAGGSKDNNTLLIILGLAAAFGIYHFIIKPKLEAEKQVVTNQE